MEERARALELLSRYRVMRAWARRRPEGLAIAEVEVTGPMQVVLRSIYEARGVRYQLRPAAQRTFENVPGPDPWSAPIRFPEGAPVGTEHVYPMHDLSVPMDCGLCSATGDQSCPSCGGSGAVRQGRYHATCGTCHGRGVIVCRMCEGSGGVLGAPTIWARIEAHEEVRALGTNELPLDVAFDLTDADETAEVIHQQEGERVLELRTQGGYRQAARTADALARAVRGLCQQPGVPARGRIVRQRLEVRRVPVFRVTLLGGTRLWVWGDPPRVTPPSRLDTLALRALRATPLAAAGASAAALTWWWLMGF